MGEEEINECTYMRCKGMQMLFYPYETPMKLKF